MASIDNKINDLANAIDDIAGQLGDAMRSIAALQFGLQRNDDSWQMWLPGMLKAQQDVKTTKENLDAMQVGWPLRVIQGALGEITIEQEYLNFHIIQSGGATVDVYDGSWDRNGTEIAMTVDVGKTYKRLSLSSDGTWYIYLALESSTKDPSLVPDTLTATASLTNPANEYNVGTYKILGTVIVINGTIKPLSITQTWYGGNIFDYWLVPDADSAYDGAGSRRYYSLESSPRGGRHEDTAQIYGFENPDLAVPTATELIPFRKATEVAPGSFSYAIYWATPNDLLENVDWGAGGGEGIGGEIGDWLNTNTYIKHNKLDFTAGTFPAAAYLNVDHDERYPTPDTPTTGVDANAGVFNFTNTTAASSTNLGAIVTTGGVNIVKNLIVQDTTAAASTAGAVNLTAGGLYAAKGVYALKGAAAAAGNFTDSGRLAEFCNASSDAGYFTDSAGKEVWMIKNGGFAVDVSSAGGGINISSGDYYHGGVQGASSGGAVVQVLLEGGGYVRGILSGGIITIVP